MRRRDLRTNTGANMERAGAPPLTTTTQIRMAVTKTGSVCVCFACVLFRSGCPTSSADCEARLNGSPHADECTDTRCLGAMLRQLGQVLSCHRLTPLHDRMSCPRAYTHTLKYSTCGHWHSHPRRPRPAHEPPHCPLARFMAPKGCSETYIFNGKVCVASS